MSLLTSCPECGTELGEESWTEGLCPGCLLELALTASPAAEQGRVATEATLEFPSEKAGAEPPPGTASEEASAPRNFRMGHWVETDLCCMSLKQAGDSTVGIDVQRLC